MTDIFISYARSTATQAQQIAEALQGLGYGIWRDDELPPHRAYAEVIEERLAAAKAVVVVWSVEGVKSEWVQSEADRARNDRKLVQVTVDGAALPMPFDRIQCADLSSWAGDTAAPGWCKVVASIADLVGGAAPTPATSLRSEHAGISVCVLPFANMSGDPEQEYFADGISEDIITDLSKVSSLWVAARNTAFTFKGKPVNVLQVAQQLKVSHVLEGSVRKVGNRVRITAQLIEGETGGHVWAERYDRDLTDIFALQDEISQAIVGALKLKLLPEEKQAIRDRGTSNLEAYDCYLRARALGNLANASPDFLRALQLYRQALAIDPGFAPARGGVALLFFFMLVFVPESREQVLRELETLVGDTLAQSPDHWAAHVVSGLRLATRNEWLAALSAMETALALAPPTETDVGVLLASALGTVGRIKDAVGLLEAAHRADPLSMSVSMLLQHALYIDGRTDASRVEYERTRDLPGIRRWREHVALLRVWDLGDLEGTRAQFRRYLDSHAIPLPVLLQVMDCLSQPRAALTLLRQAFEDPAYQDGTRSTVLSWYTCLFGDEDLAVAALRRGVPKGVGGAIYTIWFPFLSGVRRTEGFKELIRDLGIDNYWRAAGNWGDFARPVGDDDFEITG